MPPSQEEAVKAELAKISLSYGGRRTQFLSAQKTYASKITSFVSAHNDTVLTKLNEQAKVFEEKFNSLLACIIEAQETRGIPEDDLVLWKDRESHAFAIFKECTDMHYEAEHIYHASKITPRVKREEGGSTTSTSQGQAFMQVDLATRPPMLTREYQPKEVSTWMEDLEDFFDINDLYLRDEKSQFAYVKQILEREILDDIRPHITENTPVFGTDDDETSVKKLILKYFEKQKPVMARRVELLGIKITEEESDTEYVRRISRLGKMADLDSMTGDDFLALAIIHGMREHPKKMTQYIPKNDSTPIMDFIKTTAEQLDISRNAVQWATPKSTSSHDISAVGFRRNNPKRGPMPRRFGPQNTRRRTNFKYQCERCGKKPHDRGEKCPAKAHKCRRCHKIGHWERQCYRQNAEINKIELPDEEEEEQLDEMSGFTEEELAELEELEGKMSSPTEAHSNQENAVHMVELSQDCKAVSEEQLIQEYMSRVASKCEQPFSVNLTSLLGKQRRQRPWLKLKVRQKGRQFLMNGLPDSGADKDIMPASLARQMNLEIREAPHLTLLNADEARMKCIGCTILVIQWKGDPFLVEFAVVENCKKVLISYDTLVELNVIPETFGLISSNRAAKTIPESPLNIHLAETNEHPTSKSQVSTTKDVEASLIAEFGDSVLQDTLPDKPMRGKKMSFKVKDDAIPFRTTRVRAVPAAWEKAAKSLIDDLVDKGIIVPVTEPTEWVAPGHFVAKKGCSINDIKIRLVTDFRQLNKYLIRPVHMFPSAQEIADSIQADSKFFCAMDALMGYFQIELSEEASMLTTFLVPWGRYRYIRAPMGCSASSDEWCQRSDMVVDGLEWAHKIVDDILIEASSLPELHERIRTVLERCKSSNMTISRKKLTIGDQVEFAGFIVSKEGIKPDPNKVRALQEFPHPTNITELRGFLGLANQLASFVPNLVHATEGMRVLLKKDTAYTWEEVQKESFQSVKSILTSDLLVKPFDSTLETIVATDASRLHGLGFIMYQIGVNGQKRIVKCGSAALTPAQKNYATIELEMLGIVYACHKCFTFLMGRPFKVLTDHKPLTGIMQKALSDITNPRILKFRELLSPFQFELEWISGKTNICADSISRMNLSSEELFSIHCVSWEDLDRIYINSVEFAPVVTHLKKYIDDSYNSIIHAVERNKSSVLLQRDHPARALQQVWDSLSVWEMPDGTKLLCYEVNRIIPPSKARKHIIWDMHRSHAGITKMCRAISRIYFWPGMKRQVENLVHSCDMCQELRPTQPLTPVPSDICTKPMEKVHLDHFQIGPKYYIVGVDGFSGYTWAAQTKGLGTMEAVDFLKKKIGYIFGYPYICRTDCGPAFRGAFTTALETLGIRHETSSPHAPWSNGNAESAVKTAKHLIMKCNRDDGDWEDKLSHLMTIPRAHAKSPAELMFGRFVRRSALAANKEDLAQVLSRKDAQESKFKVGDQVRCQNPLSGTWHIKGKIVGVNPSGKSYAIETDEKVITRNERYIKAIKGALPANFWKYLNEETERERDESAEREEEHTESDSSSSDTGVSSPSSSGIAIGGNIPEDSPPPIRRSPRLAAKRE